MHRLLPLLLLAPLAFAEGPDNGTEGPPLPPPPFAAGMPQNLVPFVLSDGGFARGMTSWTLLQLSKFPVAQAASSEDGRAIAWIAPDGALLVWRDGTTTETTIDRHATLIGWISPTEVAVAFGGREQAQVVAIGPTGSVARPLFAGESAADFLPAADCVCGYLPSAGVFARVVVNRPVGSVSFYLADGRRHGTMQPFEGPIVAASFAAGCVYVVLGNTGEVHAAIPGQPRQGSIGVTLPETAGFAFSPDGLYVAAMVRGVRGSSLVIRHALSGASRLLEVDCDGSVVSWNGPDFLLLASREGLFLLELQRRDAASLARRAAERVAAGDFKAARALRAELTALYPQTPEGAAARRALDEQSRVEREKLLKEYHEQADRLAAVRTRLAQWLKEESARQDAAQAPAPGQPRPPDAVPTPPVEPPRDSPPRDGEPPATPQPTGEAAPTEEACILDFEGIPDARLGDDVAAVTQRLGDPACVVEHGEEGTADRIYAARGMVLVVDLASNSVVGVQALGDAKLVPEAARAGFRPFPGRTAKGIALGAEKSSVLVAYGRARMTGSRHEEGSGLAYVKGDVEMTFDGRASAVLRITIRRKR